MQIMRRGSGHVALLWYEYFMMEYVVQMEREFSVEEMTDVIREKTGKCIEKGTVELFLDFLDEKGLVEKRCVRTGFFRKKRFYQTLYDEEYFICHVREFDPGSEADSEVYREEIQRFMNRFGAFIRTLIGAGDVAYI